MDAQVNKSTSKARDGNKAVVHMWYQHPLGRGITKQNKRKLVGEGRDRGIYKAQMSNCACATGKRDRGGDGITEKKREKKGMALPTLEPSNGTPTTCISCKACHTQVCTAALIHLSMYLLLYRDRDRTRHEPQPHAASSSPVWRSGNS